MNAAEFKERFGRRATGDDLERVNCDKAGAVGHGMCGICPKHMWPRFICGCWVDDVQLRAQCVQDDIDVAKRKKG